MAPAAQDACVGREEAGVRDADDAGGSSLTSDARHAALLALDAKRAQQYFASRERFLHDRLPVYVQSEFGRLVLEDIHATLSRLVEVMPKTRTRLKWCSSKCCAGKPNTERHGPYAVSEIWDPATKKWRTVKKGEQWNKTREAECALLQTQAGELPAELAPVEVPRAPSLEQLAAIADAIY